MRYFRPVLPFLLTPLWLTLHPDGTAASQKKPVLIRVDEDEPEKFELDPSAAEHHVEVGDFYYKKDNFKAARERYRMAIKLNPAWSQAYEKLIRLLEKEKSLLEAAEICLQFVEANPDSKEAQQFSEKAAALKSEVETRP